MVALLALVLAANHPPLTIHRFDLIESNEYNVASNPCNPPRQRIYWRDGHIVHWRSENGPDREGLLIDGLKVQEVYEEFGQVYFIEAKGYAETWDYGDRERQEALMNGPRRRRQPKEW